MAEDKDNVLHTPWGITVARIFQVIFALLVFGISAVIIHGVYIDELGLCIAEALFTFIITAYLILTEKVVKLRRYYHIVAVVSLECFQWIMWLATFAATAARRAQFVYRVTAYNCQNDGSLVNSSYCNVKRQLETRAVILFKNGQILMAAGAGIGAIIWVLYCGTFIWTCRTLMNERKQGRFTSKTKEDAEQAHQLEGKEVAAQAAQGAPLLSQQPTPNPELQQQHYDAQYHSHPQHGYTAQELAGQTQAYSPQPTPNPDLQQQQYDAQDHSYPQHGYTAQELAGQAQTYSPQPSHHTAYTPSPVYPEASPMSPSELSSPGTSTMPYTAQLPIYDDHYYQTEYSQHHTAELASQPSPAPPSSVPQHSEKHNGEHN